MIFRLDNVLPNVRKPLEKLIGQAFIKKFYLAGGTAVALFFNHRRSDDLDFFSTESFQKTTLIKNLKKTGKFQNLKSEEDTLIGRLDGIKISFFTLPYALLEKPLKYRNLSVADPIDLAAMKILAISDRGTKRDFIDLYFLCKKVKPLDEFLILFQRKFGRYDFNIQHIIKSLTYFEDADKDEISDMYINISWPAVKTFFRGERLSLAKKFFGI